MLKVNDRLKFSQDVALHHVRDKGKPQFKISYKLLKKEDGYDPLLEISPYPTFIWLKCYLDVIHHCVKVVGKWVLTVTFFLPFLSQKKIWTTAALIIMKKGNDWLQKSIEIN